MINISRIEQTDKEITIIFEKDDVLYPVTFNEEYFKNDND